MTSVSNITSAFECNYCDKEYTVRTSLQSHLRTKHKKKVAENIEKTETIKMSRDIVNEVVDNAQKTMSEIEKENMSEDDLIGLINFDDLLNFEEAFDLGNIEGNLEDLINMEGNV